MHGFLQVDSVKDEVYYSSFSGDSDDVDKLVKEAGNSKKKHGTIKAATGVGRKSDRGKSKQHLDEPHVDARGSADTLPSREVDDPLPDDPFPVVSCH